MSRKRTFIVRVNIDDMSALLAGLDGPLEMAEWLSGYMVGVRGYPPRESWSEAKRIGFNFGAQHFEEVEDFRDEQKAKSDLAKLAKQAKKNPNGTHGLPTGTGLGNPAGDPIQQSNNPTIHVSSDPTIHPPLGAPPRQKRGEAKQFTWKENEAIGKKSLLKAAERELRMAQRTPERPSRIQDAERSIEKLRGEIFLLGFNPDLIEIPPSNPNTVLPTPQSTVD
jgi:hypothetical protein